MKPSQHSHTGDGSAGIQGHHRALTVSKRSSNASLRISSSMTSRIISRIANCSDFGYDASTESKVRVCFTACCATAADVVPRDSGSTSDDAKAFFMDVDFVRIVSYVITLPGLWKLDSRPESDRECGGMLYKPPSPEGDVAAALGSVGDVGGRDRGVVTESSTRIGIFGEVVATMGDAVAADDMRAALSELATAVAAVLTEARGGADAVCGATWFTVTLPGAGGARGPLLDRAAGAGTLLMAATREAEAGDGATGCAFSSEGINEGACAWISRRASSSSESVLSIACAELVEGRVHDGGGFDVTRPLGKGTPSSPRRPALDAPPCEGDSDSYGLLGLPSYSEGDARMSEITDTSISNTAR